MTIPIQSQIYNPITGVFGTGQIQVFGVGQSGSWAVPNGIGKVRVRLWGAGGGGSSNGGGGGGFALKTIYDLSGVSSIAVTVGNGGTGNGATSSFGSYVSATGGLSGVNGGTGGSGVGGDINASGGLGSGTSYPAGAGSLWGNGGGNNGNSIGASGSGVNSSNTPLPNGFLGVSSFYASTSGVVPPTNGMPIFSIDFIGIGGAGSYYFSGINGGGGYYGGYPGGGGYQTGAPGMVIVEF